jgi:EARP and GARP complex-interacting protein 1
VRFLVGTQSLKFDNQVHRLELNEENNFIQREAFLHKEGEIWHLSASPSDKNVFSTVFNNISGWDFQKVLALFVNHIILLQQTNPVKKRQQFGGCPR